MSPSIARKHFPDRAALALVAFAFALGALLSCPDQARAEVIDRIVAKINREIITLHELKRASGPYLFAFGIDPKEIESRPDAEQIYQQVLQDMINTRLLIQEASTLKLDVTDDDVSRWIASIHQKMQLNEEQFRETLRAKGIRWADYRSYVHDNLLKVRVIQVRISSRIKITDEEVQRAYKETHGADPATASVKTFDVSHIFIPTPDDPTPEALDNVEALIASTHKRVTDAGEEFRAVAIEVSAGPTAADGGYLGTYQAGDLGDAIEAVLFTHEAGQITPPIKVSSGTHIFKVHAVTEDRDPKIQEELEQLRNSLREEELNKELDTWVQNLRQKAYVRVLF